MMALFAPELVKDSRTVPVVCQQIDWSDGGDGVVARAELAQALAAQLLGRFERDRPGLAALALGVDPKDPDVMGRPPRSRWSSPSRSPAVAACSR